MSEIQVLGLESFRTAGWTHLFILLYLWIINAFKSVSDFFYFCFDHLLVHILWKLLRQVNMQHLFSINLINWNKSCIKGKGENYSYTLTWVHLRNIHLKKIKNIPLSRTNWPKYINKHIKPHTTCFHAHNLAKWMIHCFRKYMWAEKLHR